MHTIINNFIYNFSLYCFLLGLFLFLYFFLLRFCFCVFYFFVGVPCKFSALFGFVASFFSLFCSFCGQLRAVGVRTAERCVPGSLPVLTFRGHHRAQDRIRPRRRSPQCLAFFSRRPTLKGVVSRSPVRFLHAGLLRLHSVLPDRLPDSARVPIADCPSVRSRHC